MDPNIPSQISDLISTIKNTFSSIEKPSPGLPAFAQDLKNYLLNYTKLGANVSVCEYLWFTAPPSPLESLAKYPNLSLTDALAIYNAMNGVLAQQSLNLAKGVPSLDFCNSLINLSNNLLGFINDAACGYLTLFAQDGANLTTQITNLSNNPSWATFPNDRVTYMSAVASFGSLYGNGLNTIGEGDMSSIITQLQAMNSGILSVAQNIWKQACNGSSQAA